MHLNTTKFYLKDFLQYKELGDVQERSIILDLKIVGND